MCVGNNALGKAQGGKEQGLQSYEGLLFSLHTTKKAKHRRQIGGIF